MEDEEVKTNTWPSIIATVAKLVEERLAEEEARNQERFFIEGSNIIH